MSDEEQKAMLAACEAWSAKYSGSSGLRVKQHVQAERNGFFKGWQARAAYHPELSDEGIMRAAKAIETELDRAALLEHGAEEVVVVDVIDVAARAAIAAYHPTLSEPEGMEAVLNEHGLEVIDPSKPITKINVRASAPSEDGEREEPGLYRVVVEGGGTFLYDRVDVGRLLVTMGEQGDDRVVTVRDYSASPPPSASPTGRHDLTKPEAQAAMRALLVAGNRVRGGFMHWLKGAPTHVLAELLTELRKDGWYVSALALPETGDADG